MHIQPILAKTPVNDVDNYVLLLFRHLVIARQAESTTEIISSNIDPRALYVRICATSSVSFRRHKRVHPVDRLHMHGLPDRTTFNIELCQGL